MLKGALVSREMRKSLSLSLHIRKVMKQSNKSCRTGVQHLNSGQLRLCLFNHQILWPPMAQTLASRSLYECDLCNMVIITVMVAVSKQDVEMQCQQ